MQKCWKSKFIAWLARNSCFITTIRQISWNIKTTVWDFLFIASRNWSIGMCLRSTCGLTTEWSSWWSCLKMTKDNCPTSAILSLLREIKILTYLGYHPNLVSLKGAYTSEILRGIVYVATEFCQLGSLKSYLRKVNKVGNVDARHSSGPKSLIQSLPSVEICELVQWSYEVACGMEYLAKNM